MATLVSIRNLHKTYQRGPREGRRAARHRPRHRAGRLRRADGPVGLGQDHAAQPDRRARLAHRRRDRGRRPAHRQRSSRPAVALAQPPRRLRVPVLQPDADADRAEERRAAAAADQPVGGAAQAQRARSRCSWSAWPIARKHKPDGTLRRPAAARGDRARDRVRPDAPDLRRAHRRPRSRDGGRDPDPAAVLNRSRSPVGSSQTRSVGSDTMARAMATRCSWPPDSSLGLWPRAVLEPDQRQRDGRAPPALRGRTGWSAAAAAPRSAARTASAAGCRTGRRSRRGRRASAAARRSRADRSAGRPPRCCPPVGRVQPADQVEQRGLAGAGRAHQRDEVAAAGCRGRCRAAPRSSRCRAGRSW